MASINLFLLALMSLSLHLYCSSAQTWIKVGFVDLGGRVSSIGSVCHRFYLVYTSLVSTPPPTDFPHLNDEQYFSTFINSVKRRNPSVVTLLSICTNGQAYASTLSSMLNQSSYRKSFMESSIKIARKYGFQGIDLCWLRPHTATDMTNTGVVLDEWRAKVDSESRNSSRGN
ncbi:putative endochitinase [Morella rubra]|uniref:Putative endochitinase n=1 Tax=Morella rubra TaxID=262757 RepID=A0A6A1UF87_9ROSI|nr:putative endochitinase [Morella rubra]